jgi:hypothetical protein
VWQILEEPLSPNLQQQHSSIDSSHKHSNKHTLRNVCSILTDVHAALIACYLTKAGISDTIFVLGSIFRKGAAHHHHHQHAPDSATAKVT